MTSDHVPCKSSRAGGAPPHTDTDWISRLWAMSKPDGLKRRASVRALSLEPLLKLSLVLLNSLPAFATAPSNARRSAGRSP